MDRDRHHESEAIIEMLYDGVTSGRDWYFAIDALSRAVGAAAFHQVAVDRATGRVLGSMATVEARPEQVREYEEVHAARDMRLSLLMDMRAGCAMFDHLQFEPAALRGSPVYDWLLSLGLYNTLGVVVQEDPQTKDMIGFMRAKGDPAYGEAEQVLLSRVLPHLHRAGTLRARMSELSSRAAGGLAALDALPHGIFLVDPQGVVRHMNRAAEARAAREDVCRVGASVLRFADPDVDAGFRRAVAAACGTGGAPVAGAFVVRHAQGTLGVSVLPVKASHALAVGREIPLAMLVMAAPDDSSLASAGLLRDALRLTPTEARLARSLALGLTVKEFGGIEGCSEQTARTHLKNLMRKTGCHRQTELVRLVQSLCVGEGTAVPAGEAFPGGAGGAAPG